MDNINRKRTNKTIVKNCLWCKTDFIIPRCRDWREHCCSSKCKKHLRLDKRNKSIESRVRTCIYCGGQFTARQTQIDAGQGKYCSIKCNIPNLVKAGHTDDANKKRAESMMNSDFQKNRPKGFNHPLTMNRTMRAGYFWIQTESGKQAEHRIVMEKHLGRKLLSSEIVHHKDENKINNKIDNLEVMSRSEHLIEHQTRRKIGRS